jgi:hypothetical protein
VYSAILESSQEIGSSSGLLDKAQVLSLLYVLKERLSSSSDNKFITSKLLLGRAPSQERERVCDKMFFDDEDFYSPPGGVSHFIWCVLKGVK